MDCQIVSNVVLSVLSFLLAAIAVVVSMLTLKQNNRMIESSTRPYIGITGEYVNYGVSQYKVFLKNYGNSAAYIESMTFGIDLQGYLPGRPERIPFDGILGVSILPGQTIACLLDGEAIRCSNMEDISVSVVYKSSEEKQYRDNFIVPIELYQSVTSGRVLNNADPIKTIAFTLQAIADKSL